MYCYKTAEDGTITGVRQTDTPPDDYPYRYEQPLTAGAKIIDGKVVEPDPVAEPEPLLPTAEEIKKAKYTAINMEYSQKISGIGSFGIPVAKQDALVSNLRTQWKAALLSVAKGGETA